VGREGGSSAGSRDEFPSWRMTKNLRSKSPEKDGQVHVRRLVELGEVELRGAVALKHCPGLPQRNAPAGQL
jgi:hypothetical protein